MQHYSSTFFISEKSPVIPKLYSMSVPSLTLETPLGQHSVITLHFESFSQIKDLIKEIKYLLEMQEEVFTKVEVK